MLLSAFVPTPIAARSAIRTSTPPPSTRNREREIDSIQYGALSSTISSTEHRKAQRKFEARLVAESSEARDFNEFQFHVDAPVRIADWLNENGAPDGSKVAKNIEPTIKAFAQEPSGGLIVAPSPITTIKRELITALAARLNLPAIFPFRHFPESGGLVSYGIDQIEQARGGASYIDSILRGANPNELPVQLPTKYELVVNLKTAKTLGLDVPWFLQQRADEVIE